jgi:hypothetical protein
VPGIGRSAPTPFVASSATVAEFEFGVSREAASPETADSSGPGGIAAGSEGERRWHAQHTRTTALTMKRTFAS